MILKLDIIGLILFNMIRQSMLNKIAKEQIPGGLSSNITLEDIAKKHKVNLANIKKQLKKGIKVEKEHTNNDKIAKEIAKDHLFEDPNYYDKLKKIEK